MQWWIRPLRRLLAKFDFDQSNFNFWIVQVPKLAHEYDSLKHILVAAALEDELLTTSQTIPKIERR